MNELVVIKKQVIGENEVNAVDARELHLYLESKQKFADWIDAKVVNNPFFVKNEDWVVFRNIMKNTDDTNGGRPRKDYALTLDTAKKVAMAEQTAKGNEVRDYFLMCEKKLKTPMSPLDILKQQIILMEEQEKKLKVIEQTQTKQTQKLLEIESKVKTSGSDFYSVSGYANLKGYKNIDVHKANLIGKYAAKLSREYDYEIGKVKDERFGQVNIYHIDMLLEAFKKHGHY